VRGSVLKGMLAGLALLLWHPAGADGQIMRRPQVRKIPNWLGGGVGFTQRFVLDDGPSGANWDFGSGLEFFGRFERPTQSGIHVGLQAGYAELSMRYTPFPGPADTVSSCPSGCEATGTRMRLMGLAQYGGGYGFHGVYELLVGVTGFSNFREAQSGSRVGPRETDYDFSFALGYGFGFGLSPSFQIEVVQELGTIVHQKTGLSASSSNYPRVLATRLGAKVAF
jgi:hypothetical protein